MSEFADEDAITTLLSVKEGESRPLCCDPGRASRKARAREEPHGNIIAAEEHRDRLDRMTAAGCTPLKSQVNTEPRGALGLLVSLGEKVLIAIPRCTSCGDAGLGRGTELRSIISPKGLKALMYRSLNHR